MSQQFERLRFEITIWHDCNRGPPRPRPFLVGPHQVAVPADICR
jgi:hypothetical protein